MSGRAPAVTDPLDAGTCKGCQAPILWATTVHGRPIPLDPKPELRFVRSTDVPGVVVMREIYTPHHATCPDVNMFRRARAGADAPPAEPEAP